MSYNNRSKSYLDNLINDLRNAIYVLRILYDSSVYRAEREGTGLSVALIKNLGDVYNSGLETLCVSLPQGVRDMPFGSQYAPPLVYARNKGNRTHQRRKAKEKMEGAGLI